MPKYFKQKKSQNHLKNRKQLVVSNGLNSSWKDILTGVPQGTVSGPHFSFSYTQTTCLIILSSICKMFTDETSFLQK